MLQSPAQQIEEGRDSLTGRISAGSRTEGYNKIGASCLRGESYAHWQEVCLYS